MRALGVTRRMSVVAACVALTATGCNFQGLNSLPLPGTVGRGSGAQIFHAELANIGTMEPNSPVLLEDVVVGSVAKISVRNWHVDVEVGVRPDVVVPANATATVGQTSLLGSMHLALDPPPGQSPRGRLSSGATISLDRSATYPSTEQTLAALSAVVNSGGLGQISDVIHNAGVALAGREGQIRDLLGRFNTFMGTFDDQRGNIVASTKALNSIAGTFAEHRDVLARVLQTMPPALDVLIEQRPQLTTALDKLRVFSNTATGLINDTQADLVRNLENLEPTICSLAEVGSELDSALAYATVFPYGQNMLDRGVRGDYFNVFVDVDITRARIKQHSFAGTGYQQQNILLVPAPGDAGYEEFMKKFPNGDGFTDLPRSPAPPDRCVPGESLMARAGD